MSVLNDLIVATKCYNDVQKNVHSAKGHYSWLVIFCCGIGETFGLKNETKQSTSLFLNKQIMKAGINFNINLNPLITQKI